MELAERFRYIMKLNQLSASAFADEIGVQRSSISHILSGRNKPSLEFIQKVLQKFPKVDANWLINGTTKTEHSMHHPEPAEKFRVQSSDKSTATHEERANKVSLEAEETGKSKAVLESMKVGKIKKIVVFYENQTFEEFNP